VKVTLFRKTEYVLRIELSSDMGSMLLHTLLLWLRRFREVLGQCIEHESVSIILREVLENFMLLYLLMARGGIVVKSLRYKLAGRGFNSRWCHWNFSVT
jgi:hypothetical protein